MSAAASQKLVTHRALAQRACSSALFRFAIGMHQIPCQEHAHQASGSGAEFCPLRKTAKAADVFVFVHIIPRNRAGANPAVQRTPSRRRRLCSPENRASLRASPIQHCRTKPAFLSRSYASVHVAPCRRGLA